MYLTRASLVYNCVNNLRIEFFHLGMFREEFIEQANNVRHVGGCILLAIQKCLKHLTVKRQGNGLSPINL